MNTDIGCTRGLLQALGCPLSDQQPVSCGTTTWQRPILVGWDDETGQAILPATAVVVTTRTGITARVCNVEPSATPCVHMQAHWSLEHSNEPVLTEVVHAGLSWRLGANPIEESRTIVRLFRDLVVDVVAPVPMDMSAAPPLVHPAPASVM